MISTIDHEGTDSAYGYTKDDDGKIWYWSVPDDSGSDSVEFQEYGYPTDHPYPRTGEVPEEVREHAETYVDASRERGKDERY